MDYNKITQIVQEQLKDNNIISENIYIYIYIRARIWICNRNQIWNSPIYE